MPGLPSHHAVGLLAALAVSAATAFAAPPVDEEELLATVREILAETPLIDGHNDAPWQIRDRFANHLDQLDFTDTSALDPVMHTDLKRMREGGVGGQFWSVWVPTSLTGGEAVQAVLEQIDLVRRLTARYPDHLEEALTADDIVRVHRNGRIACLIGIEGGYGIGESLAVLRQVYALGARSMTLTHWDTIAWADAATDEPEHGGLSPFGVAVVEEMNRLGMIVDLSHVSLETMVDAMTASRAPVVFSHSAAAALNPHPRNVPDQVLRLVAANGGLVMVNLGSFFISEKVVSRLAEREAEKARLEALHPGNSEAVAAGLEAWRERSPEPEVTLADVVDHVDHISQLAGIDHVGIGSDFDGVGALPRGLADVSGYPQLLAELVRRGYTRQDVAKVAGGNLLRVMREVESVAARLQRSEKPRDLRIEEVDGGQSLAHEN